MQHLLRLDPKASDADLRSFIGGFVFNGDMATTPIAPFSGGEKARLALALLVYQRPNLLLLDEPTNHLDLEMREALGMALQDYKGALVVISHDRHLLRNVCDTLLLVKDGAVQEFDGDLDDYRQLITSASKSAVTEEKSAGENSNAARKDKKRLEAERRQQLKPLRDKVKKLEQQMEKLQIQKSAIEGQLADPAIYGDANKLKLKALLAQQTQTTQTLDQVEGDWLEASEALEALESDL